MESPKKFLEEFKSKNCIKTAESLNSHEDLEATGSVKVNMSKKIEIGGFKENFKHLDLN